MERSVRPLREGGDRRSKNTSWLCVQDRDQPGGNRPIFVSAVVPMRFNLMAYPSVKTKGETMSDQATMTSFIVDEQAQFNDGARKGHNLYCQLHRGKTLHPRELYDFLMNTLIDTTHASVWNAGYIAGWFTALSQDGKPVSLSALVQDASLLLEQVQAHAHLAEEEGQG